MTATKPLSWIISPLSIQYTSLPLSTPILAGTPFTQPLLVVGGSLGAQALNEVVPAAIATMPASARPQVVHQAGEKNIAALRDAYAKHAVDAECVAFIDDMAGRYAWADFVICRGGALTISELAAVGLGALVVPLPGAIADEQSANARFLVDAQAAWMEPQGALSADRLAARLQSLDRAGALAMAQAAHALGKRDAAARVADVCIEFGARA